MPSSLASESSRKRREILPSKSLAGRPGGCAAADFGMAGSDIARESFHVLIAPAGKIQDHDFIFLHFRRAVDQLCDGMRGFERRNNAFDTRKSFCRLNRLYIAYGCVFRAPLFGKPSVLGANA